MIIHEGYDNLDFSNPVVTLGIFDGVHLGHRSLLDYLVKRAHDEKGESVVITFYPHPRLVLSKNRTDFTFLTSLEEKITLLEKTGTDHLIVIPFSREFSNIEACKFIEDVLIKRIGIRHLIVGFNHHFGRKGEGNYNTIKQCAELFDFIVEQVPPVQAKGGIISSSLIREALLNGQLEEANTLLGYEYFMNGTIVEGKRLGRTIGFPTANIKPDYAHKLIPKDGVYAVEVHFDDMRHPGMLSIGYNPTVNMGSDPRTIEVNIFNFKGDIYGSHICTVFRYRIRDEIKFDNLAQLTAQLEIDKMKTLQLLAL
jgi:riboflavin kinase/FMN adenylyltransferase